MRTVVLAMIALFLAACAGGTRDPYSAIPIERYDNTPGQEPEMSKAFVQHDGDDLYLDFNSGGFNGFLNTAEDANKCVQQAVAEASKPASAQQPVQSTLLFQAVKKQPVVNVQTCIQQRNKIINDYLRVSDLACRNHLDGIQSTSVLANTGLSFTTNVATALGTFVTGSVATKELAALGNVANSTRSVVNEQVYFQAIVPQITRLIRDDRKTSRANIVQKMTSSPSDYTLDQALADLSAYHASCSFSAAMEQISTTPAKPSVSSGDNTSPPAAVPLSLASKSIVTQIQNALNKDDPKLKLSVDGTWGKATADALSAYQKKNNLPATPANATQLDSQTAAALDISSN